MKKSILIPLFAGLTFFLLAFLTIRDYGPSWDETIHFRRGQSYLHYFLTGEKNYNSLPKYDLQNTQGSYGDPEKIPTPRRSFYQNDIQNGEYFLNKDIGHPPLNDILAATSNLIFYQKMAILDDISSHHLFNILTSSLLVFAVTFLSFKYFGVIPAIVSFLVILTYPLFFSEAHFNIKDPPETAFFTLIILFVILSLEKRSKLWLVLSAVTFAFALGTKFNVLFLPFMLVPYIYLTVKEKPQKSYLVTLLLTPIIVSIIFIGSWPYLWQDISGGLFKILAFYKEIGSGLRYQPDNFFILGFNTYPLWWIMFTTPPITLILTVVGLFAAWINKGKPIVVLLLFWFLIPIIRVSLPGTTIYGGVRQILEFLPAMAIICALGAWQIREWFRKKAIRPWIVDVLLILVFIWPFVVIVKLHPYQNVYFNSLIGGLGGAEERNFPSWGNSLGSAYKGGIEWINKNAEKNAKLTLIQGTPSNVPPILLRKDINYLADGSIDPKFTHFSGINRDGEYIMELIFNDTGKDFYYMWDYVDNFLLPVYELKVDGTSILKIWKNDLQHTKKELSLKEKNYENITIAKIEKGIKISLKDEVLASRLQVLFKDQICLKSGFIETSLDETNWQRELDIFPQYQAYRKLNFIDSKLEYFFAGRRLKYIRIIPNSSSCILNDPEIKITIL